MFDFSEQLMPEFELLHCALALRRMLHSTLVVGLEVERPVRKNHNDSVIMTPGSLKLSTKRDDARLIVFSIFAIFQIFDCDQTNQI